MSAVTVWVWTVWTHQHHAGFTDLLMITDFTDQHQHVESDAQLPVCLMHTCRQVTGSGSVVDEAADEAVQQLCISLWFTAVTS